MGVVKGEGHIVCRATTDLLLFHFTSIRLPIPEIQLFQNLTLKIQGQGHTWGQGSRSYGYSYTSSQSMHFHFFSCQSHHHSKDIANRMYNCEKHIKKYWKKKKKSAKKNSIKFLLDLIRSEAWLRGYNYQDKTTKVCSDWMSGSHFLMGTREKSYTLQR